MATSSIHRGFKFDRTNARLNLLFNGTTGAHYNATAFTATGTFTATGAVTMSAAATVGTTLTVTGLLTASAAATVTTGNLTTTAGDNRVTAGNVRLGAVATFGTTEPTSWIVFKSGTQPAGAITTSGGLGANDTTVQKIIAASTINNVET